MDVFARVVREHRRYFLDALLAAAWDLGLPDVLPGPPDGVDPQRLGVLLDALPLAWDPSTGPPPRPEVVREGWGRLAEVIRTGRPLHEDAAAHHHALSESDEIAATVAALGTGRLLDVGGGTGAVARAFGGPATVVELPEVLPLVRGVAAVVGPIEDLAIGEGYDVALLSHVLHLHGPERAAAILSATARHLAPGGRLVVRELTPGTEVARLFAVNLLLYTAAGEVHAVDAIAGWMRAAGIGDVARSRLHADALLLSGQLIS